MREFKKIHKYSHYTLIIFLFSLSQLLEAGFLEMWRKKWWPNSQTCSRTGPTSSAQSLELPAMSGIFILVGIMTALALIVLSMEHRVFYKKKKKAWM